MNSSSWPTIICQKGTYKYVYDISFSTSFYMKEVSMLQLIGLICIKNYT